MSIISPNKSKRKAKIDTITIHCMACNATVVALGNHFAKKSAQASSNYGIGSDGLIACYVPEEYRSWCSSSAANDQRAITIEVANDGGAPDWHVSKAALSALVDLLVDICKRNGIPELRWKADKSLIGQVDKQNMTVHRWFAKKACVPTYSEVLTRTGWVKISDIEIGDEIACADIDNLRISFEEVYDKVPVREQDTYTCNEFTATMDHRMIYKYHNGDVWRIDKYKNLLNGEGNARIPLAGYYKGSGLPITDDMLCLLVAVQADGHYMYEKNVNGDIKYYGLEFHLKKERKIERAKELLENNHIDYTECKKSDGSVSLRAYNQDEVNIVYDICEKYLENKHFTWEWIELSERQAEVFLNEIKFWDGCIAADLYTSRETINLDIVNAIAALNGVGSRVSGCNVQFRDVPINTIGGSAIAKRNSRQKKTRHTEVTCVSVKTGIFLVRQNGKTFIIGNCPGDYLFNLHSSIAAEVNARLNGAQPKPEKIEVAKYTVKKGDSGENVKLLQKDLNQFGCGLKEDGKFGPASVAALKAWQTKYKLTADGSYGPKSYKKMCELLL